MTIDDFLDEYDDLSAHWVLARHAKANNRKFIHLSLDSETE